MKISTKGRYGLRIIIDIANASAESPRTIADICRSQNLSEKYVGRIILSLSKAELVESVRGSKGGFRLIKPLESITLLDIVTATEGPINIVDCVGCPNKCTKSSVCQARRMWCDVNSEIRNALSNVKIVSAKHTRLDSE